MKRADQSQSTDLSFDTVTELGSRTEAEVFGCSLVREISQAHDDTNPRQQGEFPVEERTTREALVGQRRISGWRTLHCGRHPRIPKLQTVIAMRRGRLIRKAGFVHGAVQPVAAAITGEHPARSVCPVSSRRQTQNQDPSRFVAETRYASTPVVVVTECRTFFARHLLTPIDEARTFPALVHVRREPRQGINFPPAHMHTVGVRQVFSEPMARSTKSKQPSSTTVLLVRHGQTPTTGQSLPGRAKGLHLSDVGHQQARDAAERLAAFPKIDAVYASPLERTRETAAPLAKKIGQRVSIHKGLIECDFGDWTGAKLVDLMKKPEWSTVQRAPSTFRFPNGESFTEMQVRITTALDEIRLRHPGGVVVCFSHADPIKAALSHAMGTHLDLFQRIVVSTCSVSALAYGTGSPIVLTVNSTGGSLADLRPS